MRLRHQHDDIGANRFFDRVVEKALRTGAPLQDAAFFIDRYDAIDDAIENRLHAGAPAFSIALEFFAACNLGA